MSKMIVRLQKRDREYLIDSGNITTKNEIYGIMARKGTSLVARRSSQGQFIDGYMSIRRPSNNVDEAVYGFVLEKIRRRTKKMKVRVSKSAPDGVRVQVLRRNHWVYRIYRFPVSAVHSFEQLSRTFKVVLRSA